MLSDPVQSFWNSLFAQVQDRVSKRNEESGPHLKFERIPNGFRVCRESPFLAVERWLDDSLIYGCAKEYGKSDSLFQQLTITGENAALLPEDPLRKSKPLTTDVVAGWVLDSFQ